MLSFAGLSLYTLLANNPESTSSKLKEVESLVTSAIIVESAVAPTPPVSLLDQATKEWMDSYNQAKDLSAYYLDNALLFPEKADPIKGGESITGYYSDLFTTGTRFTAVHPYQRFTETTQLIYETGYITTDKQDIYQYMTIWKNAEGSWKRELETIAKKTVSRNEHEQVNTARSRWIQLCNSHRHDQLIAQVYAADAYYYNRGRLLQGRQQLTEEYKYMANPMYQLTLTPLSVQMVQPDMVYEIGKGSGSYGGHYMIRWEKQPATDWQVTLDTNY